MMGAGRQKIIVRERRVVQFCIYSKVRTNRTSLKAGCSGGGVVRERN